MTLGAEQLRPAISLDIEKTPGKKLPQEKLVLFGFDIIPDFEEVLGLDSTSTIKEFKFGGRDLKVQRSFSEEAYTNKFQLSWNEGEKSPSFAESMLIDLGEKSEQENVRVIYRPLGDYRMVGKVKERICYTWDDQSTLNDIRNLLTEFKKAKEDQPGSQTSYKRGLLASLRRTSR